jgi:superfamily II DNA or RNA helicase
MDKLLPYQQQHAKSLINILAKNRRVLDASKMGLGKTYCNVALCVELKLIPFIVCPKTVMENWLNVLEYFGCSHYGITSYESLQKLKYWDSDNKRDVLTFIGNDNEMYEAYENEIPEDMVIIYDEVHKCKNINTNNGSILHALTKTNVRICMLSGTVADLPIYFVLVGLVLKLYDDYTKGHSWIIKKSKMTSSENYMLGFHKILYPNYASKINEDIVKNLYPECEISAKCYNMDTSDEIEENYNKLKKIYNSGDKKKIIGEYIRVNQAIELLKIPTVVSETKLNILAGNSVVIFVNYTKCLLTLSELLDTKCLIYGEQTIEERYKNIKDFQQDRERIIICNIKCGSTGISLHDLNGTYPRVSLLMPTWSVTDLIQALGRIYRVGVKTKTKQIIIFSNSLNEKHIQENIKDKLNNISLLNNGYMKNEPLFKISNLIEKTKDISTGFGAKPKLNRVDKQKINKEIVNQKIINKKEKEKKEKPFLNNDYDSIIKYINILNIKKQNIEEMPEENEDKIELFEKIIKEIEDCDKLLEEMLLNIVNY